MKPVKLVKRSLIYQGRVIRLVKDIVRVNGQRLARETILHPGAVVILPVLPDRRIVFVRQYRRAVDRFLLELPAGTLEPGEPRASCAKRELLEETGWNARQVRKLGQFYAAPGFVSEQMTLFLAQKLVRASASPEPDELVTVITLTLQQALAKVKTGSICDAKTLIGLWHAQQLLRR
jgi:ADP-ribose pyrophosphatase